VGENRFNPYDDLPYAGLPFPQTHPDRLAAMARLFGLSPPDPTHCRVLELGCASGDNLIPLAAAMPGARFVGLDLSARQVAAATATIAAAGLPNIEIAQRDLADLSAADGTFDYIIAHGLYSWVPDAIRDQLLAVCRDNLAPNGVAYVSYKTYPGWSTHVVLRDMMRLFAPAAGDAATTMQHARALLDVLGAHLEAETPYGALLRDQIEYLRGVPDGYMFHDHLEEASHPVYFHEFVADAHRHGLEFMSEAGLGAMGPGQIAPKAAQALQSVTTDYFGLEQLIDVLVNRSFRQSLLVHAGLPIVRRIDPQSVFGFTLASPGRTGSRQPSLTSGQPERFEAPNGSTFTSSIALAKSALLQLIDAWPNGVAFDALFGAARTRLGLAAIASLEERRLLGEELLRAYAAGIVELRVAEPRIVAAPGQQPVASPLARHQAARGGPVTTLLHMRVNLDPYNRTLLQLLDGTRDSDALRQALADAGVTVPTAPGARADPGEFLRKSLQRLAKVGLLLA
jgi:SAM-dependent methyltransferase